MNKIFYITIGVPGSGKSTGIKNLSNAIVVSTDDIREQLFGNLIWGNIPENNTKVWKQAREQLKELFLSGTDVVLDATNLSRKRRSNWFNMATKYGYQSTALYFDEPWNIIKERNKDREGTDKHIPLYKLKEMYVRVEPPLEFEAPNLEITIIAPNIVKIMSSMNAVTDNRVNLKQTLSDFIQPMLGSGQYFSYENGKYHQESLYAHLSLCQALGNMSKYPLLGVVGAFHDIGKDFVRKYVEKDNTWTYYNHDILSSRLYYLWSGFLDIYNQDVYEVIRWHMAQLSGDISNKVINREHLTELQLDMLRVFSQIDSFSRVGRKGYESGIQKIIK